MRSFLIAAALTGGVISSAHAVDVEDSIEIAAGADEVWAAINEFCSIKDWHPVVAGCELSDIDGASHRKLVTGDGAELLEKLLAHDDAGMNYTYTIIESPLPVAKYVSTIGVSADGAGSVVSWSSSFDAAGATDEEAAGAIAGIYAAGLGALKADLEK